MQAKEDSSKNIVNIFQEIRENVDAIIFTGDAARKFILDL